MQSIAFVLVHGAWHGGWCYRRVVGQLEKSGYGAYAPSLTGLADRSHLLSPDIGLQTHIDDVVNLVKWENLDRVILCGHSYGGVVITGAAEILRERVAALVFLDAVVPEAGQSMLDCTAPAVRARWDEVAARSHGAYLTPIPAKAFGVNEKDRAWVDAQCTPQPYRTFRDPVGLTTVRDQTKIKYYVRATTYASTMMDGFAASCRARPDWHVIDLPYGHDLMVDAPEQLAAILIEAADRSGTQN